MRLAIIDFSVFTAIVLITDITVFWISLAQEYTFFEWKS